METAIQVPRCQLRTIEVSIMQVRLFCMISEPSHIPCVHASLSSRNCRSDPIVHRRNMPHIMIDVTLLTHCSSAIARAQAKFQECWKKTGSVKSFIYPYVYKRLYRPTLHQNLKPSPKFCHPALPTPLVKSTSSFKVKTDSNIDQSTHFSSFLSICASDSTA